MEVDSRRVNHVQQGAPGEGPVVYWMSRDQRVSDNWALLYAQELALKMERPLVVAHNLLLGYLGGEPGRFDQFKVGGLQQVASKCETRNIGFAVYEGQNSDRDVLKMCRELDAAVVVMDMNPLRIQQGWLRDLKEGMTCDVYEVDAHNIVPIWQASGKQEYAAYTIRPKIHKVLKEYMTEFPQVKKHLHSAAQPKSDWQRLEREWKGKKPRFDWTPGERAAQLRLNAFIDSRLKGYSEQRNDPNAEALSDLSPYFHYGHLAPQRAVLDVLANSPRTDDVETFIEEAVVRRELSDNFCYYNPDYDALTGAADWARKTLAEHEADPREYVYSFEEFENARTHDPLWNAAQRQMVQEGKMHGYMRMYWAKKMLEWTNTPATALRWAIELNDKYELDGRDPNGYVGVMWSIAGVHDRAWTTREVFGKIRYMNYNGCKRKFDVDAYMKRYSGQQTMCL